MSERAAAVRPAAPAAATAPARANANARRAPERARGNEERPLAAPSPLSPPPMLRSDDAPPDFARIHCGGPRIHDADLARARLTAQLLGELGRAFGLDLSRLEVRVDADAAIRIQARGANALQEDARVLLHPDRYRPREAQGRYLLAHETAHAAQRSLAAVAPGDTLAAAEAEADALGAAFARGDPLHRPRVALRSANAAADNGQKATAEAAEAPALAGSVKTSRSRELELIRDALDGWWVSDGDVFKVMRILDTVEFDVAVAMVGALSPDHRYWLADNINPPHMYRHRRSVLASYRALEPSRYDAIDLKALRALPDQGLDLEETQALIYIFGQLPAPMQEELRASEKGEAIARLVNAPAPNPDVLAKLAAARKQTAADEAALAKKREALLKKKDDPGANDLIGRIRQTLQAPTDADGQPRHPNANDAIAALAMLYPELADDARFGYIGEQLERDGLIDLMLELLPPEAFVGQSQPWQSETLSALVQTRLPYKNEQLLEDLLSYHLLDWAIRDHEALFAYRLLQTLPMPAQYRFRQREDGKYYLRLIDNLPRDEKTGLQLPVLEIRKAADKEEYERMLKLGAQGASVPGGWRSTTDTYYYDASGLQRQRLDQGDARDQLQALVKKFKQKRRWIYSDGEAVELYGDLVKLGAGSLERGHESPGDEILLQAYLRELDSLGFIDELFNQLPESFLFNQNNRVATLKIILARDPLRVRQQARELVSRGLFSDWMVKDWEAYLAFQCVKALPDDERQAFIRDNPDTWARIQAEMGPAMRQARDINAYVGDREGTDRAGVLAQLNDPAFWTVENEVALRGALRMAMAMSEHRYAFERSQTFNVIGKQPKLATLLDDFRLWNPAAKRDKYEPEMLKGTRWHEEGVFASLKSLWGGLVTLWNMDVLFVDGKIGARLDLNDVQKFMGGDLMGMQLAKPSKRSSKQEPVGAQTNKLTLLLDPGWLDGQGKSAELILPQLLIESSNIQRDGSTLQTGQVDLRQLHIRAAYDSQNQGQAAQAQVSLDSLVANDVLFAKSRAMYTIARLTVTALRLAAGSVDSTTGAPPAQRKGRYIPFPLLVLMVLPWLAQLAALGLMATGINRARGLADQGLEPDNRFGSDLTSRIRAIDMSFGSLTAEGFASSGGQRVAHAEVQDFAMRVGLNKATRLRAELASIAQRKAALQGRADAAKTLEELDARSAELERQRAAVETQEQEYLAIQAKLRAGGQTPDQQKQLQADLDRLDFEDKGGAFLDIGKVAASGIEGTVTSAEPIVLNNIHGQGSSTALMGFLSSPTQTPAETARRAKAGERAPALATPGHVGDFGIDLGDVHTGRIEVAGGVRTVESIDKKLEELGDVSDRPHLQPLVDSLQLLRPKAQRYQAMVAMGLSALSKAELEEFAQLRKQLTDDAALIIESIDLTRARLDLDLSSGHVGLSAQQATIAGLQLPQQGITVEQIKASGLRAGALPAGGLLDWSDWKKNLRDAELGADTLQIDKARSKYHGLLFEKATLTGPYARVKQRGNQIELGLNHLNIEGLGVVPRLGLLNQRLRGLREKARAAADKDKPELERKIGELSGLIGELQALADQRHNAYLSLQRAQTPAEIAAAKEAVAQADGVIALNLTQYGAANADLDEFGIEATGAGDVLSDVLGSGFDPIAMLERGGVAITGSGPGHRAFKSMRLQHAQTVGDKPGSSVSAEAGEFAVGETRLDINAKKEGDEILIEVPTFEIDSLSAERFVLTSSDEASSVQIWSDGRSGLEALRFSGTVKLSSRVKGSRELSDYRLASVHIKTAGIGRFYGQDLGLALPSRKLEVQIKSGSINGIRSNEIDVVLPADDKASPLITGADGAASVSIDSIDKLVVGKAMAGAWSGSGRLDAKDISVGLLADGAIQASIGDLDLSDMLVRGPDGWARFSLSDLGAKLTYRKGALDLDDVHFGTLQAPALHWKVGASGFVDADQPVTIRDVRVKGRIEFPPEPDKADPAAQPQSKQPPLQRLKIDRLHVGSIDARHLIYQDENHRVEIGPEQDKLPKHMRRIEPLRLTNLDVWGLDWQHGKGVVGGRAKLDAYQATAQYEGLKSKIKAGAALTGTGMTAQVKGPGVFGVDIGRISKIRGFYHDDKIDTKFLTGSVVGSVTLGPDFIEAESVEVNDIQLGRTTYTNLQQTLELGGARIAKVKLGKVRQNFAKSEDPKDEGGSIPTTLEVRDLDLTGVAANSFIYHGSSKGTTATGEEQSSTQDVTAKHAEMEHLRIGRIDYDTAAAKTTLGDVSLDEGEVDPKAGYKPKPFSLRGLDAKIVNTIGDKETTIKLLTDVEAGPLTSERMVFDSVVLGSVLGKDGKQHDIVRSRTDGAFVLSYFGLINPDLTITDEKGNITRVSAYDYGSIKLSNLRPKFLPNNTIAVSLDSLAANRIQLQRGSGKELKPEDPTVKIDFAELRDIAVGLKGMGTKEGLQVLGAKIGLATGSKIQVDMQIDRRIDSSDEGFKKRMADYREALKKPSHALIAEPLSGMSGDAEVEPENVELFWGVELPWDPNLRLPIRGGRINFDQVSPYAVNIREGHLTLGDFGPEKNIGPDLAGLPGIHANAGEHGMLDLRELVEGLYSKPPTAPKRGDTATDLSALRNLNFGAPQVRLGSGKLGVDLTDDKSLGPGDIYLDVQRERADQNVLRIPWQHVGDRVELLLPQFHAKGAGFPGGKTGAIDLFNVYVRVGNLAEMQFTLHVWVGKGFIKDIEFGDVKLTTADALSLQPAPEAKDMPPSEPKP
ncbi:DUF4157 domain-containing protein [Lysobacter sp. K5869]|uniref:eCIS core domain-containing protein n=1 Tax=Lysobacter sp. K5869 TaxID=2820808 RepID=UPI001C0633B0|nr:DUF4157 domain-containing protein [Lysobacter sp. K5869]QWP78986.1 DUF4157 domain-containing protein [Lysobacter sp. K5869]